MRLKKLIAGSVLALTAGVNTYALTPTNIFVFGDSLSDAGFQNTIPTWSDVLALAGLSSAWPTGYWLNDQACIESPLGPICLFPEALPSEQKQPTWTTFYYSGVDGNGRPTGVETSYTWSQLLLAHYNIVTLENAAMNQASVNSTKITGTTSYNGEVINPNNLDFSIEVTETIPGLGEVDIDVSVDISTENIGVRSMPDLEITGIADPVPLTLTDIPNAQPQDGEPTGAVFAAGGSTTSGQGIGLAQEIPPGSGTNYLLYYPPSTQVQVEAYLEGVEAGTYQSPNAKQNSVYIFWAGANNIFQGLSAGAGGAEMFAIVDNIISNIMSQAELLIDAGANHVVILNLPNLGSIPLITSQNSAAAVEAATLLSVYYNTSLTNSVNNSGFSSKILIVNIFDEMNYMVANGRTSDNITINGSPLYFTNVSDPACGLIVPGTVDTPTAALTCTPLEGTVTSVNYENGDYSNWTTPGQGMYLFTDAVHPSAEGHKAIQILVQNSIEGAWNQGESSSGWNSFWDFLLQIISLGMAKN